MRLVALAALLLLAACSSDMVSFEQALSTDPAPACLTWNSIYASGTLSRYHGCDTPK